MVTHPEWLEFGGGGYFMWEWVGLPTMVALTVALLRCCGCYMPKWQQQQQQQQQQQKAVCVCGGGGGGGGGGIRIVALSIPLKEFQRFTVYNLTNYVVQKGKDGRVRCIVSNPWKEKQYSNFL